MSTPRPGDGAAGGDGLRPLRLHGHPLDLRIVADEGWGWAGSGVRPPPATRQGDAPSAPSLTHLRVRTASGAALEVVASGRGRPLVLIPGLGVTAPVWTYQLMRYAPERRVVVVHKPGHGASELTADVTYEGLSAVLHEVLAALSIEGPVDLVGTCVGALVALQFASDHPGSVSSLVLVSAPSAWAGAELVRGRPDRRAVRDLVAHLAAFDAALTRDLAAVLDDPAYDQGDAGLKRSLYSRSKSISPAAYLQYVMDLPRSADALALACAVRCPTLVVAGERDAAVGLDHARVLRRALARSSCTILQRSGHFPYLTHPDPFNRALDAFYRAHAPHPHPADA